MSFAASTVVDQIQFHSLVVNISYIVFRETMGTDANGLVCNGFFEFRRKIHMQFNIEVSVLDVYDALTTHSRVKRK